MELSKLGETGLKIKSKTGTVVVDPAAKTEADIIILIDPKSADTKLVQGAKVVIDGPGEYEVSGISITGEKVGQHVMYRIDDEISRVLLAPSEIASSVKEEEGEQALVLKSVSPFPTDTLNSYVQDVCVVFGEASNLPTGDIKKTPKINLRRMEDLKGSLVVLAKE